MTLGLSGKIEVTRIQVACRRHRSRVHLVRVVIAKKLHVSIKAVATLDVAHGSVALAIVNVVAVAFVELIAKGAHLEVLSEG